MGYILAADFRGGLRKTHDRRRGVRIDPSRSSEVDDFRIVTLALSLTVSEIRRLIG